MSNCYGTEIEIWAGFRPVGNNEKKNWGRLGVNSECFFFIFSGTKRI